jgi:sortase A
MVTVHVTLSSSSERMLREHPQNFRRLEYGFLLIGVVSVAIFASSWILAHLHSQRALQFFTGHESPGGTESRGGENLSAIDFALWSPGRIKAYQESLRTNTNAPIGVLEIEKIHLRVPVFTGTSELALSGGAGWIEGTAWPGRDGNVGIASHRDGFFRGLKDVHLGDEVKLLTHGEADLYVVDHIEVVKPTDVSVLKPGNGSKLTLVTCYPFYYVGSAPERYIVQGARVARELPKATGK